jgi:hypothetical protein
VRQMSMSVTDTFICQAGPEPLRIGIDGGGDHLADELRSDRALRFLLLKTARVLAHCRIIRLIMQRLGLPAFGLGAPIHTAVS